MTKMTTFRPTKADMAAHRRVMAELASERKKIAAKGGK